jgi:demethylmenaquinone methyltransferase/2-methoxy-6-polyprenyl-1,4-benzoquinol methylase/phosphoethanolamine N-methyltransferase
MAQIARRLVLPGVAAIGLLALAKRQARRKTAEAPQTEGRVLHAARWYDLFGTLISFGRDKAIRQQLIDIAAPAPGEKVLDVGCGTGTLALALDSRVGTGEISGIDASPEMIEVARKKATQSGATIDFQVALIEAIPFPDATFDLVTSSLMLHHLPDDLKRQGLIEIARVLKPGGIAIFDYIDPTTAEGWAHLHADGHRLADVYTYHAPQVIDRVFAETGFEGFERQQFGKSTYLTARRARTA